MNKTPLIGRRVTVVCDEVTLKKLFAMQDWQWENFNESEFMFFIGDIEGTNLNEEQMELYGNEWE